VAAVDGALARSPQDLLQQRVFISRLMQLRLVAVLSLGAMQLGCNGETIEAPEPGATIAHVVRVWMNVELSRDRKESISRVVLCRGYFQPCGDSALRGTYEAPMGARWIGALAFADKDYTRWFCR
jgi:hypothetical protein